MKFILILCASVTLTSCSCISHLVGGHDKQFLQIYYHCGVTLIDTFHGIYRKDLVPGSATTTMWFTTREQEILLTNLERFRFFSLPDTLYATPNVHMEPNPGEQILRVKCGNREKTVVWYSPIDPKYKGASYYIGHIMDLLIEIIVSKPEYKVLPTTKGGYS